MLRLRNKYLKKRNCENKVVNLLQLYINGVTDSFDSSREFEDLDVDTQFEISNEIMLNTMNNSIPK